MLGSKDGGPGGTQEGYREIISGTNLPEITKANKLVAAPEATFQRDQSRMKYSRMSRNSRGSIQTESPAAKKFTGGLRNNNQAIRLRDIRAQGIMSEHNDYGHVDAFGPNRLRDIYAQKEAQAM